MALFTVIEGDPVARIGTSDLGFNIITGEPIFGLATEGGETVSLDAASFAVTPSNVRLVARFRPTPGVIAVTPSAVTAANTRTRLDAASFGSVTAGAVTIGGTETQRSRSTAIRRRRWVVKRNGESYFFDDVNDIEAFLKAEPTKEVVREEPKKKKTVVLKSKQKIPDEVVETRQLEPMAVPQIMLPKLDLFTPQPTPQRKVDTDEQDFLEFLSIL
jgi:hypothetical protein